MAKRATFTLDEEAYAFLCTFGARDKRAFINSLLKRESRRYLEKRMLKANLEEAEDADYQQKLSEWDVTALDGIDQ